MTSPDAVFDPGAQIERTLLAWQRTALALVIGSAVAIRVLAVVIGPPALVIGVAGLVLAAVAYGTAWRRYRLVHRALAGGARLPDAGVVIAIVGGTTLVLGLAALAVVLVAATRTP